jgi:hypothetical protein
MEWALDILSIKIWQRPIKHGSIKPKPSSGWPYHKLKKIHFTCNKNSIQSTSEYRKPKSGPLDEPDTFWLQDSTGSVFKWSGYSYKMVQTRPEIKWPFKTQTIMSGFQMVTTRLCTKKRSSIRMTCSSWNWPFKNQSCSVFRCLQYSI